MAKLSVRKVEEALRQERGVVKYTAAALGVSRWALHQFLRKHPDLSEVRDEARNDFLDVCERKTFDAVDANDVQTARWALELLGKDRGYSRRIESTGADGEPLVPHTVTGRIVDVDGSENPVDDI